jgi:hypothetical protein
MYESSKNEFKRLEPAPGWCKHCQQYTIEEPLPAVKPDVPAANFGNMEPVAWVNHDFARAIEAALKEKNNG